MTWIKTIACEQAGGRLKKLYDRIKGPGDKVDNIMLAHSLRPHTMEGHMTLYKNVLHHSANSLSKSRLETIGVYVSLLNECDYCVEHHFAGLCRMLGDDQKAADIRRALEQYDPATVFDGRELAGLEYAEKLTTDPGNVDEKDIDKLRAAGLEDGEILEINQVTAYFAYANRTVLGLGVNTEGDILGLSPGDTDDAKNWSHT
ncbi:MAG: carboxymuconolactone decarboxylase family protein [Woeseia sp.]